MKRSIERDIEQFVDELVSKDRLGYTGRRLVSEKMKELYEKGYLDGQKDFSGGLNLGRSIDPGRTA